MHADGKPTLASVSKWNSRKVNCVIFSQAGVQTWYHTSAYHLSALENKTKTFLSSMDLRYPKLDILCIICIMPRLGLIPTASAKTNDKHVG